MLNKDQWEAWKKLPESLALFEVMKLRKEKWKERWAAGEFTDQSAHGTTILNAKGIGNCEALDNLINIDFDVLTQELADAESDRFEAAGQGRTGGAAGSG